MAFLYFRTLHDGLIELYRLTDTCRNPLGFGNPARDPILEVMERIRRKRHPTAVANMLRSRKLRVLRHPHLSLIITKCSRPTSRPVTFRETIPRIQSRGFLVNLLAHVRGLDDVLTIEEDIPGRTYLTTKEVGAAPIEPFFRNSGFLLPAQDRKKIPVHHRKWATGSDKSTETNIPSTS